MSSIKSRAILKKTLCVRWIGTTVLERIDAVEEYLKLAATRAEQNIEYVHNLRVATRRAMAVLEFSRSFFAPKRINKLLHSLRRIRKAAGEARDMDVFLQNHKKSPKKKNGRSVEQLVVELRRRVQQPIREIAANYRRKSKLRTEVKKLFGSFRVRAVPTSRKGFYRWIKKRFQNLLNEFIAAEPFELNKLSQMHRFRIRCKEIRYTVELLADFSDPGVQKKTVRHLAKLQDRLGQINDLSVACSRLNQWKKKCDRDDANRLGKQLKAERKELEKQFRLLSGAWSYGPVERLEKILKNYLKRFPSANPSFK